MSDPSPRRTLRLGLEGPDVTLGQVHDFVKTVSSLLGEVVGQVPGVGRGAVRWVIADARASSFEVALEPRATRKDIRPTALPEVISAIAGGLRQVQDRPERPAYFTDRALEHARELVSLVRGSVSAVRVRDGEQPVSLTGELLANVDRIIGATTETIGTVEGRLEALSIHERQVFSIWDARSGRRYECHFAARVPLAEVLGAFGKRVAARGLIRGRKGSDRVTLEVRALRVFPDEEDLPSASDVRGLLRGQSE
jgi:hypothetical protein